MSDTPAVITRKKQVADLTAQCLLHYEAQGTAALAEALYQVLLQAKVRFPLLEFCAARLHEAVAEKEQPVLCEHIAQQRTIGGHVLLGIILQKRLTTDWEGSFRQACRYIEASATWYGCDIIGERVFGHALLHNPKKAIPLLKTVRQHPDRWVLRAIGPGIHYATKKGLAPEQVRILFEMLLDMAQAKDRHVKQGIGWAAKTIAKFHPELIGHYRDRIDDLVATGQWFRTKIRIGLERNAYLHAQRNPR